jgi:ATP-binding cassette subfamily B protein
MLSAPLLGAFYDFANNYALKLVVDAFSAHEDVTYEALFWPIAIFIFAQVYLDFIWRASDIAEWRSEPYVRQSILTRVFEYVEYNPYKFFQDTQSGTITSRIKGILDGYDNFWAAMHHDFTARVANTIVLTAVLAIVSVKVCLLVAAWALCFFIVMYYFSNTLDRLSFAAANYRHAVIGFISDNIANIFTVFSFAARKRELKSLDRFIEKDFIPSNIRVYKFSFYSNLIAAVFYWVMLISIFLFMIHLRRTKEVSSGDVVFVMGITLKMSWELWQMIQKLQTFMKNIGDFKSAFELMKVPHNKYDNPNLPAINLVEPSIVFEDVTFSYDPSKAILDKLSLHIRPGEKVGLVGVSGAGKSSLVSLLLKYFQPESGRIFIDSHDISQFSSDSIRKHIAVIPQDIMLFHRTIFENILYGDQDASKDEVVAAARMANIHDVIIKLPDGYDSMVGERGVKLSGGQRQRIAIARAILKNAPILILDEATSSLDTNTENLIQTSLNNFLENSKTTVIAIAHRLSTLKHMDRIIVLEQGRIIEEGTHDELIAKANLYKKLWEMQRI